MVSSLVLRKSHPGIAEFHHRGVLLFGCLGICLLRVNRNNKQQN